MGTAAAPDEARQEAMHAAHQALAIDPSDHSALLIKGMLLYNAGQSEAAMVDIRRAHELNPNDAPTLGALGFYEALVGNTKRGIAHTTHALRLSPRDPRRPLLLNLKAWAHFAAEEHTEAAEAAQMAVGEAPDLVPAAVPDRQPGGARAAGRSAPAVPQPGGARASTRGLPPRRRSDADESGLRAPRDPVAAPGGLDLKFARRCRNRRGMKPLDLVAGGRLGNNGSMQTESLANLDRETDPDGKQDMNRSPDSPPPPHLEEPAG